LLGGFVYECWEAAVVVRAHFRYFKDVHDMHYD
jgi:hypothetical protein